MNILIAHNFSDFSYADSSRQLALSLASKGHQVIFISHSDPVDVPEVAGFTLKRWPEKRPTGFTSFMAIYKIMKTHQTQVLLAHAAALNIAGFAAMLVGVERRIGYYHSAYESTIIDNNNNKIITWLKRLRKAFFYKCYHKIVCVSGFAASDLHRWFNYPLKQTIVIHNALADRNLLHYLEPKPPLSPMIFFAPGRLEPCKNSLAMAMGFIAFAKQHAGKVILNIAGTGPLAADIAAIANENDCIQYLGQVPYADIDHYIAKSHIVVCSTLAEAFGMSIIEAMMHATPVLASAVGGPAEIITDGETGWLVDGATPQVWQQAFGASFQFVQNKTAMYEAMRTKARQKFLINFQQKNQIDSLSRLLKSKTL